MKGLKVKLGFLEKSVKVLEKSWKCSGKVQEICFFESVQTL